MASRWEMVGLGEVLWDVFPDRRLLGGAPLNCVFQCHQLGTPSVMLTRVGQDELGHEVLERMQGLGLSRDFVQVDSQHATGRVDITLDARGQAEYVFANDVAFDHLTWDECWEDLMRQARAVCFGTLAQRVPSAAETVQRLLALTRQGVIIFDINLRQHFYNRDIIERSLHASHWVKLNDDELRVLEPLLDLPADPSAALRTLRQRYDLSLAAMTRGAHGCLVQTGHQSDIDEPGVTVQVVDTVGAGDAFTAGLITSHLQGLPLREGVRFANRFAARVAAAPGGTPVIPRAEIDQLR